MLNELKMGEPSQVQFDSTNLWLRAYDLPAEARSARVVLAIAKLCGEVLDIDKTTLVGMARCIRVKVKVDIRKPLKKDMTLDVGNKNTVWIPFKYERLPSFCFVCGTLGHMRRECDLLEESNEIRELTEDKLPYGEWMRAVVDTVEQKGEQASQLRRALFEKFKNSLAKEDKGEDSSDQENSGREKLGAVRDLEEKLRNVMVSKGEKGKNTLVENSWTQQRQYCEVEFTEIELKVEKWSNFKEFGKVAIKAEPDKLLTYLSTFNAIKQTSTTQIAPQSSLYDYTPTTELATLCQLTPMTPIINKPTIPLTRAPHTITITEMNPSIPTPQKEPNTPTESIAPPVNLYP